ncbi:hypothetical protein Tco_0646828 [Tanacetum coccineum]
MSSSTTGRSYCMSRKIKGFFDPVIVRDAIFDENRFSLVPRPSIRILNGTEDIGGSVVPEEVTEEVVTQQPEPETRKGKRNSTPKELLDLI